MNPIEKTQAVKRVFLPVESLLPNEKNPNVMTDSEFNMLASNIELTGITDPILVRSLEDDKYRVIGGHHRLEVAKVLGFSEVPCTVIDDPEFDVDQENFQVVRMNVIRGHLSPQKFMTMYATLSEKYAESVMAESFGFVDEDEFRKLLGEVKKTLPKDMQADFQKAAKELQTIDQLSKLLNSLFSKYGNTLPYGYMLLDFGGKDSVWLRMGNDTRKALIQVCHTCVDQKRTVDDIIGGLIQLAAKGQFASAMLQLIADSPEVEIPEDIVIPTQEALNL